ncbi:hypothetical protein C7S17_5781 [Burkholderia thailandensis]|nr:hypothetical protein [Burkholderia thailandensis]
MRRYRFDIGARSARSLQRRGVRRSRCIAQPLDCSIAPSIAHLARGAAADRACRPRAFAPASIVKPIPADPA